VRGKGKGGNKKASVARGVGLRSVWHAQERFQEYDSVWWRGGRACTQAGAEEGPGEEQDNSVLKISPFC